VTQWLGGQELRWQFSDRQNKEVRVEGSFFWLKDDKGNSFPFELLKKENVRAVWDYKFL
jgi:hypothetical protein